MGACVAATTELAALQHSGPWPHLSKGPAPTIAKLMYLNLDESRDRRSFMERQIRDLRGNGSMVSFERFPALTAKQVKTEERFKAWRQRGFNPMPFPKMEGHWGTAANMLSKYLALRELDVAKLPDGAVAMLVEDDATISPDFEKQWKAL